MTRRFVPILALVTLASTLLVSCAGMSVSVEKPAHVVQVSSMPWLPPSVARWSEYAVAAAKRNWNDVDPDLLLILILVESGGNPKAVGPNGGIGLMQILPNAAKDIAAQRGIGDFEASQLFEPEVNIDFGAWYMGQSMRNRLADAQGGSVALEWAVADNHMGAGAVNRVISNDAKMPPETQQYQHWVVGMYRSRQEPSPPIYAAWLAAGGQVLLDAAEEE